MSRVENVKYSNIDSSQMTPELWAGLSKTVDRVLSDPMIKGAVITHGTDTMAEGAYFLDLTLNTDKPVVFVGAGNVNADVYKAIEFALKKGVAVVLATRVYHGGGETLEKAEVILGGDLTGPKARILLMIALPHAKGDLARLRKYFKH